ncbi:MAG TPA: preprotein translocase subunit YajC [Myxococcaceae bacterium]|nr:preprotein translocase subunit YajC [Myxococcaceae bacterium]
MLTHQVLLAQTAGGSPSSLFIFIAGMFAIMYFLMIRPQQKQLKEHKALLANLKKGDRVVTQGGIIGRIFQVDDREVQLEVATNVKLRVLKTSVQTILKDPAESAKSDEAKAEKESK